MKKETVIAISLGILAGISIAGVVIVNSRNASGNNEDVLFGDLSPTVSINTSETTPLLVTSPDNETIIDKATITIKGSAQKGALVVIQTPLEEWTLLTTSTTFSQALKLMPGENNIRIASYDKKNIDSRTLSIYSFPAQQ